MIKISEVTLEQITLNRIVEELVKRRIPRGERYEAR